MSWRDRFQEGSFRGAAFLVTESRAQFGRRNQVHEYPGRDTPFTEDLGKAADRWSIVCEVVGPDYDVARDALIAALKAKGPGTLVHPYLGAVQASLETPAEVAESTAQGGMATFTLSFVEPGANTLPAATPDTQAKAVAAAANVQSVCAASVAAKLSVLAQPAFVLAAAEGLLATASGAIGAALAAVQPLADGLTAAEQMIGGLVGDALGLLQSPAALVAQVFAGVASVGDLAAFADDALVQLGGPVSSAAPPPATPGGPLLSLGGSAQSVSGGLLGFGAVVPPVVGATPPRLAQAVNQTVLIQLVRCAAAAAVVGVVADMDFTSYDDAVGVRDPLAEGLDGLALAIADTGDDDLARAVDDLRLALIADVTARGASLARLYKYTPSTTEPALVIAQRLYGDGTRADDIIARNASIQHPGFVAAGVALEVLSDG